MFRKWVTESPCDPHFISQQAEAQSSVRRASGFVQTGISYFDPGTGIYPSVAEATGMSLPPVGMCRSPEDENASSPFSVPRQMEPILADGLQGRRIEDHYHDAV
jgi:hypothetical protein